MTILSRLLRRKPQPEHRKGVPSDFYWLADRLEDQRKQIRFAIQCVDIVDRRLLLMQTAIDDFNAVVAALAAKVDEFLARPRDGLPVEKVREMAASVRAILDKFPA